MKKIGKTGHNHTVATKLTWADVVLLQSIAEKNGESRSATLRRLLVPALYHERLRKAEKKQG